MPEARKSHSSADRERARDIANKVVDHAWPLRITSSEAGALCRAFLELEEQLEAERAENERLKTTYGQGFKAARETAELREQLEVAERKLDVEAARKLLDSSPVASPRNADFVEPPKVDLDECHNEANPASEPSDA